MSRTKKVKISIEMPELIPLQSIAINQLHQAKKEIDGHKFRWIIPSMIFSVFSLEAMCNVYGSQIFDGQWRNFESTSIIGKVILVSKQLGDEPDFSAQPWQTIQEMVKFRNWLAHAKPHITSRIDEVPLDTKNEDLAPLYPELKLSSYSEIANAERYRDAIAELQLRWIHGAKRNGFKIDLIGLPKFTEII
ncbi:hypothetical protein ACO2CR_06435 [Aeromonas caviae]